MTGLLEKVTAELAKLPEDRQESMAQWILDELEDELRWDQAFAASLPQLDELGKRALEDYRAGRTQELDRCASIARKPAFRI